MEALRLLCCVEGNGRPLPGGVDTEPVRKKGQRGQRQAECGRQGAAIVGVEQGAAGAPGEGGQPSSKPDREQQQQLHHWFPEWSADPLPCSRPASLTPPTCHGGWQSPRLLWQPPPAAEGAGAHCGWAPGRQRWRRGPCVLRLQRRQQQHQARAQRRVSPSLRQGDTAAVLSLGRVARPRRGTL